jgi:squalene synthase HpnC
MAGIDPRDREVLERLSARSAAQMGGENFPVALRFLPSRPRARLSALYTYARFVDDVGDEADGDRCALLDQVEQDVRAVPDGRATLSAVRPLETLVAECDMPLDPFLDLIEANRLDQRVARRESFDDLLAYCRLSAAPVGRTVLYVAGAATEANVADSDAVCAALQVLEHCQDVVEDARAGRVYLPQQDLRAANVTDSDLLAPTAGVRLRQVVALNAGRASDLLRAGDPLVRRLSGWAKFAVAGYVAGGLATAAALRRNDYDVLVRTIRPSRVDTAVRATRLLVGA